MADGDHDDSQDRDQSDTGNRPTPHSENPSQNYELEKKDEQNYLTRWIENSKFIAAPKIAWEAHSQNQTDLTDTHDANNAVNEELAEISTLGNFGGLLIGILIHYLFVRRKWYQNNKSQNPLYRNFKTLASVGTTVAVAVAGLLPFTPNKNKFLAAIIADIACFASLLIAIPYWLIRKALNIDSKENKETTYAITGVEGWSKYGKTSLVFGTGIGQFIAALIASFRSVDARAFITIWSSVAGVAGFILGMVLVPMINKIYQTYYGKRKFALDDENKSLFRNNYVRSGMTLGLALGIVLGFIVGTFLFPGVGSVIGMFLGGGLGSVVGGVALGWKGHKLTAYTEKQWNIPTDTENSWDYATRTMSFALATVGSLAGFLLFCFVIPMPGMAIGVSSAIAGAALGGAVTGSLGWFTGFPIIKKARALQPVEDESTSLPWSQRIATGVNTGTVVGAVIGLVIGLLGGPLGILGGIALGSAIGGMIGGMAATFYGDQARAVIKKYFIGPKEEEPVAVPTNNSEANKLKRKPSCSTLTIHKIIVASPQQDIAVEAETSSGSPQSPPLSPTPSSPSSEEEEPRSAKVFPMPETSPFELPEVQPTEDPIARKYSIVFKLKEKPEAEQPKTDTESLVPSKISSANAITGQPIYSKRFPPSNTRKIPPKAKADIHPATRRKQGRTISF